MRKKRVGFLALFVLIFFLIFYPFLQSPGLTGGDAGDLVTAAVLKGVAHPPGYPLYTFLGWLLTRLPAGSTAAWRIGLLSSMPAAVTVLVGFLIAWQLTKDKLISLIVSFSLAFNYLFWHQAEGQEVFALHLLFLFLTLWLALLWQEKPKKKWLYFLALVTGLEFAHHHTYVLLFPALFYWFGVNKKTRIPAKFLERRFLSTALILFLIGALFYFYVPWAAAGNPPVNWEQVNYFGLRGFLKLVTRAGYGSFSPFSGADFSIRSGFLSLWAFFNFLFLEFTWLGMGLIFLGGFRVWKRERFLFNFLMLWLVFAGLFFQFYAGYPLLNWFVLGTVERFYLLVYPVLIVFLSLGLLELKERLIKGMKKMTILESEVRSFLPSFLTALFLTYPLFLFWINFEKADLRDFYEFDKFGQQLLEFCPPNSIFISTGDLEIFSASYVHFIDGFRPDLKIMSLNNPKMAIFYYSDLAYFRKFFIPEDVSGKVIVKELKDYFKKEGLGICVTKEVNLGEDYVLTPQGLVNVYYQNQEPEFLLAETEVEGLWRRRREELGKIEDPKFDSYFVREIIRIYGERALVNSKFFFEAREYERARFWLEEAEFFEIDEEIRVRLGLLLDIAQKRCDSAAETLIKERLILEGAQTWPLIEATYEKECLGNEEKYNQLRERIESGEEIFEEI